MNNQQQSRRENFSYTPNIIIKFKDMVDLPYQDELENFLLETGLEDWQHLIDQFPGISISRLFTSVPAEEILDLVEKAKEIDLSYQPPNFLSYFLIDLHPQIDAPELIDALEKWYIVEFAYLEERPSLPAPCANPSDDPRFKNQGYLKKAPQGIDAEYAWQFTNACGNGINFIDVEYGWKLDHEDLKDAKIQLIEGINSQYKGYRPHGTAVLGIVVGTDNKLGGIGVAHAAKARVISAYKTSSSYSHANAILKAVASLSFGDVLLLEIQTNPLHEPIEVEKGVFEVVRLGTALGICVVEPAGNGGDGSGTSGTGINLDTYPALNRNNSLFKDSGSIMVGAAKSTVIPYQKSSETNYGNRVDCFAWGDHIDTCDTDDAGKTSTYNTYFNAAPNFGFGGTSGASAIIAGAALILQGLAEAKQKKRLSGWQMRKILSDPTNGTDTIYFQPTIGVMPDLKKILSSQSFNKSPDVYIRDYVGDQGNPHTGAINASPDIILLPNKVIDPQKNFGENSGTENNKALGHKVISKQDNYIYVRVRNRGGTIAKGVEVKLYHSPVSTLLLPKLWEPIDKSKPNASDVSIPSVPIGDILTVSDPITWKAQHIPKPGHYCFIGLIGNELDPAPKPADFNIWNNYYRFIRDNNNVTWRNFVVENKQPQPPKPPSPLPMKDYSDLPFLVAGAPDVPQMFQFKVVSRLPEGAEVWLAGSDYFLNQLQQNHLFHSPLHGTNMIYLPINAIGETIIGEAYLAPSVTYEMTLYVYIPEEWRIRYAFEIYVSQLWKDPEIENAAFEEVGRVTWRLISERFERDINRS